MAEYFLDDSRPDDSGAGTSAATAKKTPRAAIALITSAADILRVKDNGNWYTLIPTSAGEVLSTVNSFFVLPYVGSTTPYKFLLQKDPANPTFFGTFTSNAQIYFSGGYIRRDWSGTTNTTPPFYFTNNAASNSVAAYLTDCTEEDYKTDNPNTAHLGSGVIATGSGSAMIRTRVKQIHTGGRFRWHNGSSLTASKRIDCWGSVVPPQNENIGTKMGDRFIIKPPISINLNTMSGSSPSIGSNNTYVLDTTSADQWVISGPTGTTVCTPFDTSFNNLWVKTGINNAYGYRSATSYTFTGFNNHGNNIFANFTALSLNITGLVEQFGTSTTPPWTTSIFKSLDPDNANFLLIDETQTSVVNALKNMGFIPGTDIGYNIPTISGGETDVNKVLNTSTIVSGKINPAKLMADDLSGAGTLSLNYVLTTAGGLYAGVTAALVKIGQAFGVGLTGTYDGSDRWSDPGESNVNLGVAYKANSLTNNKTGTNESTDPGVTNVVSGINYKINSVSKTGTRTAIYNLLAQALVKIGSDRGDGQLGTYDASERYSDIDLNQVVAGYNFRYNSLTNNRTGLRSAIYNLLSAALVKINIDRGDGVLGTYDGSDRYTDPGIANVRYLTDYKFNSLTNNRTGAAHIPGASDVRDGVAVDNTLGSLDVEAEANLPIESNVKEGSGAYGPNLDKVPALPLSAIEPSQGGTSVGAESNDNINPNDVTLNLNYLNLGVNKTGTKAGSSVIIPADKVLYPFAYVDGEGSKVGQLGAINGSGLDIAKQLGDNAGVFIQSLLGANWLPLAYFKDVEKNDFNNNAQRWGIRCTTDTLTEEKFGGKDTLDLTFEIKLTTDFDNREGDDFERAAELALINQMEAIRRQLRLTKFFAASNVRIIKDWSRAEAEKIGNNVILLTAEVTVNLDINNG